jgi:hypothetical protein
MNPQHNGLDFTQDEIEIAVERLRHFLDAVLDPDGLYEIRPVPHISGGSIWTTPRDLPGHVPLLMGWNRAKVNPYFSLNPRKHHGATKGTDTLPGSLVVADFDSGSTLAEARAKIAAAGLPLATAIVQTSADHWHFYWRLADRLPDLATHKRIQRGLAETLATCPNVCSHQQVMRLPGPFCNVKPDRPTMPRVQIVECDPNRIYDAAEFPLAAADPTFEALPLDRLAITIEKNSLSDAAKALVETGTLFPNKGRRASIFEAARDMHARGWELSQAAAVLVTVGGRLGLEPDDQADIPRQVRNAFATPASPGYAVAETATIQFPTSGSVSAVATDDYDAELEALPLPEAPAMPPRPALALNHGIIGDFMRRVEFETEAHPVALASTLLVALGSVIDRGPHYVVGRTPHHVNLYLAVVGNTGAGRKGTGGDIVADCVRLADPFWAESCQSPNLVSGEGVIDALRDRVEKIVPKKGGGPDEFETVVIDPGIEDKRLLITCAELVSAFKAGNRENSVLSQTLREAWDGKTLRTMAKNAARTATDPHLSIIGHATRHELVKVARESDIFGGTYNRFLFVLSERARLLPHGGDLDDLGTVPQRIADVVTFARTVGRMRRTPEADRLWERVYGELTTATGSDLLAAVLSRGEAQTLRLSMLMALAAGRAEITADDLAAALDLWRYSAASARVIFAGVHDALFNKIVEAIKAQPGITRSALHKTLGWKLGSAQLVEALSRVQAAGLATCQKIQTGGRPSEQWRPRRATENEENDEKGSAFSSFPPPQPTAPQPSEPAPPAAPAVAWTPGNLAPGRYSI